MIVDLSRLEISSPLVIVVVVDGYFCCWVAIGSSSGGGGGVELAVMISSVLAVENRKKVMTLSKQRISRSKGRSVSKGRMHADEILKYISVFYFNKYIWLNRLERTTSKHYSNFPLIHPTPTHIGAPFQPIRPGQYPLSTVAV